MNPVSSYRLCGLVMVMVTVSWSMCLPVSVFAWSPSGAGGLGLGFRVRVLPGLRLVLGAACWVSPNPHISINHTPRAGIV